MFSRFWKNYGLPKCFFVVLLCFVQASSIPFKVLKHLRDENLEACDRRPKMQQKQMPVCWRFFFRCKHQWFDVGIAMPLAPSPIHHQFYGWYKASKMGGLLLLYPHYQECLVDDGDVCGGTVTQWPQTLQDHEELAAINVQQALGSQPMIIIDYTSI